MIKQLTRYSPLIILSALLFAQTVIPATLVNPTQLPPSTVTGVTPHQSIYPVSQSMATANQFIVPTNTTGICIVTRNIAQSPGIDYNIMNGFLVFTVAPEVNDVVEITCF